MTIHMNSYDMTCHHFGSQSYG